ncbi:sigma-70 family RNA polymerase sigma factor [Myxococcota bacterium]|nr:sigma-70 family RNA polymerase sigma factor [Myxococcota bacterium]MBU1431301.1 sigma-70 family RNA polymerase sigma factor [Myxococcota bacterium]MBU1896948.1 sigma-70 family RNA polymerase sigma factor [Myxococcota bacterium]
MDDDAALMCRVRDGDVAAFNELFARWRSPIVRFTVRFVGHQARGEELAQDIFLKIYRARARYEPREAFKAYLFRVATNHCLNEVRRAEYRRRPISVDELLREPMDTHGASPDALIEAARMQRAVREAVASLPETQRAVLLLQKEQGMPLKDIADLLETTVSAVKSLLTRARRALMVELAPFMTPHAAEISARGDLNAGLGAVAPDGGR